VVFLADLQDAPKSTAKEELTKSFGKYIDEGLLTVIETYPEYYPLTNTKKKYSDSSSRRTWRSKENVDTTFIMCYCKDFSQYYIHLEDDVISSPNFLPKLQDFINARDHTFWPMLDVAVQGSIAKVYHSQDLGNLASYFYLMYDEMPIDWLMEQWRQIKELKPETRLPRASLFQHIGDRSSLQEKGRQMKHTHTTVLQSRSLCPADEVMKSSKVTKLGRYPQTQRKYVKISNGRNQDETE